MNNFSLKNSNSTRKMKCHLTIPHHIPFPKGSLCYQYAMYSSRIFSIYIHTYTYTCFFFLIYLYLAALGLCCCARSFPSCGERGLLFVAVRGLLIVVASLVAEHGL